MNFGSLSYLITILIFAGTAVLIEWIFGFPRLKKYIRTIVIIIGLSIIGTLIAEPVALHWKIWFYSPNKFSQIYIFGTALETLIFAILVATAIASATLIWSEFEEEGKSLIKASINEIKTRFKIFFKKSKKEQTTRS